MRAEQLITNLETKGVTLVLFGDRLRIQPRDSVPQEWISELRAHKGAIVHLLRSRVTLREAVPGHIKAARWPLDGAELLAMPLHRFAKARRVVEVFSQAFGETVVLASDNAALDPGERRAIYRASELRQLLGFDDEDLRAVHAIKRLTLRGTCPTN